MTRDENQFHTSPVKRQRLVARQPLEARKILSNESSASPGSGSINKPPFSLRGSIFSSPKSPRATILPPRVSPSSRSTPGSISRATRISLRNGEVEESTPKSESLGKSVRFAQAEGQKREKDPPSIFCDSSSEKEELCVEISSPLQIKSSRHLLTAVRRSPQVETTQPASSSHTSDPSDMAETLQKFMAMTKEDRQKLQNLLNALNLIENDYPQQNPAPIYQLPPFTSVINAAAPTEVKSIPIEVEGLPIKAATSVRITGQGASKSFRNEAKTLNPEAPAFPNLLKVKDSMSHNSWEDEKLKVISPTIISPTESMNLFELRDYKPIEIVDPATAKPINTKKCYTTSFKIQPATKPDLYYKMTADQMWNVSGLAIPKELLNWKMNPSRTWPSDAYVESSEPLQQFRPKLGLQIPSDKSSVRSATREYPVAPPVSPNYAANVTDWLHNQPTEPKQQAPHGQQQPENAWLVNSPWSLPVPPPYSPMQMPPVHMMPPWLGAMPFYPIGLPFPPASLPPQFNYSDPHAHYQDAILSPGRVGAALPPGWADRVLDNFAMKYPLTGFPPGWRGHNNSVTSSIAGGKNLVRRAHARRTTDSGQSSADAAIVQQQLEELILEKKEKDALAKMNREEMERRAKWQRAGGQQPLIDL